jgi:NADH-quinone oxidoreductase subunit H
MSWWSLAGIAAVVLGGALALTMVEQLVAGRRPAPALAVRRAGALLRRPIARPWAIDAWLYHLAPPLLLTGAVLALAMVPWTPGFRGLDFEVGAILFSAALAYVTPAILMAGWSSGQAASVVGGFRFLALMLAYEMPIVMAVTAAAAPAESLRPTYIVEVQAAVPMALSQPLAFALFLPSVMAVAYIRPFDLPQADSELGGGAFAHYSGAHAAIVALAQKVLILAAAGMTVALFLGGWHGPWLPDWAWMTLKTGGLAALMLWIGRRVPRFEIETLLSFAWKFAIPAAIGAIAWGGLVTLLFYR